MKCITLLIPVSYTHLDVYKRQENMFPGDSVSKDFNIQVSHQKAITLYYHADIRPGYEVLAEVLHIKIELPEKGETLYNGLMRDMPNSVPVSYTHLDVYKRQSLYRGCGLRCV